MLYMISGNYSLFKLFFDQLKLLLKLPYELSDISLISDKMKAQNLKDYSIKFDTDIITQYENNIKEVNQKIQNNHLTSDGLDFKYKMILFFILRIYVVYLAYTTQSEMIIMCVSLIQFIILPYSLFVSFFSALVTGFNLFISNMITFPILRLFVNFIFPDYLNLEINISISFIVLFFIFDQVQCLYLLIKTPTAKTKAFSFERIIQSFVFGFLNGKTYHLSLLLLMRSKNTIPLTAWIIDALLGISKYVYERLLFSWGFLFYNQHRLAHLPYIYNDAHKFHHYLHDTTPFDAHLYGSGAPEEFFLILIDVLYCSVNMFPPSLCFNILKVGYESKIGHTRKILNDFHLDNFHADHHLYHRKNFSITYGLLIDYLFETSKSQSYAGLPFGLKVDIRKNKEETEVLVSKIEE